jgi:hypothetical protein
MEDCGELKGAETRLREYPWVTLAYVTWPLSVWDCRGESERMESQR